MKFDCGDSKQVKNRKKRQWHQWFAWHPVRVGERDCRWLETVYRKGYYIPSSRSSGFWDWSYSINPDVMESEV